MQAFAAGQTGRWRHMRFRKAADKHHWIAAVKLNTHNRYTLWRTEMQALNPTKPPGSNLPKSNDSANNKGRRILTDPNSGVIGNNAVAKANKSSQKEGNQHQSIMYTKNLR